MHKRSDNLTQLESMSTARKKDMAFDVTTIAGDREADVEAYARLAARILDRNIDERTDR